MPRLAIDDGYTLEAATKESLTDPAGGRLLARGLPVVTYRYRPALPDALAEWRYASRMATSGRGELDATAKFVADHLVSWDVTDAKGAAAPISPESVRRVPDPILNQIVEAVANWAPKELAAALGNSPPA